jgi:hypothetical protein
MILIKKSSRKTLKRRELFDRNNENLENVSVDGVMDAYHPAISGIPRVKRNSIITRRVSELNPVVRCAAKGKIDKDNLFVANCSNEGVVRVGIDHPLKYQQFGLVVRGGGTGSTGRTGRSRVALFALAGGENGNKKQEKNCETHIDPLVVRYLRGRTFYTNKAEKQGI